MKALLIIFGALCALTAHAETKSSYVGLEVSPIPTALSVVPDVSAFQGGAEIAPSAHLALVGSYTYLRYKTDEEKQTGGDRDLSVLSAKGHSAGAGVRIYPQGARDSFYVGGMMENTSLEASFIRNETPYAGTAKITYASASAGYRWLWNNGINLRLGGIYMKALKSDINLNRGNGEALTEEEKKNMFGESMLQKGREGGGLDFTVGYLF